MPANLEQSLDLLRRHQIPVGEHKIKALFYETDFSARQKKVGIAKASLHRWVCPRTKEILTTKGKAGRRSGENVFLLQVSGFFSFSEADCRMRIKNVFLSLCE